jgi:hypothetical protein
VKYVTFVETDVDAFERNDGLGSLHPGMRRQSAKNAPLLDRFIAFIIDVNGRWLVLVIYEKFHHIEGSRRPPQCQLGF